MHPLTKEHTTRKMTMSHRECYQRVALFQKADRIPNMEGGLSERLLGKWRMQGLPKNINESTVYESYFGLEPCPELFRSINYGPIPGVPIVPIDKNFPELKDYRVSQNVWGRVVLSPKNRGENDAENSFILWRGALQDRSEWNAIKGYFRPDIETRYGDHNLERPWAQEVARLNARRHVAVLEAPSMIGMQCYNMGFENYCLNLYDESEMMEEIVETVTRLALQILDRAFDAVDFDMLWFWEDMAYRNGPIISPEMFERLAVPRYKQLSAWYRSRGGEDRGRGLRWQRAFAYPRLATGRH